MSISSSICADYANKRKEIWTKKFRDIYKKATVTNANNALHEFMKLVKEIEEFKFVE